MRLPFFRRRLTTRDEVLSWANESFGALIANLRVLLGNAQNYAEMVFVCDITGEKFIARIERATGETPHQARAAAEQERDRLKAILKALGDAGDAATLKHENDRPRQLLAELSRCQATYGHLERCGICGGCAAAAFLTEEKEATG